MAAVAGGVCGSERVVAIDVAGGAGRDGGIGMSASQGPASGAVIEFSVGPEERVVASGALRGGEACGDVIGDVAAEGLRAGPVGLVTAVAIGVGRSETIVAADVTLSAGGDHPGRRHLVRTGQWPAGSAVIEGGHVPADGCVAIRTIGSGESRAGCGVTRIVGLLPGGEVAARIAAIGWGDGEVVIIVDVAGRAGNIRVPVG